MQQTPTCTCTCTSQASPSNAANVQFLLWWDCFVTLFWRVFVLIFFCIFMVQHHFGQGHHACRCTLCLMMHADALCAWWCMQMHFVLDDACRCTLCLMMHADALCAWWCMQMHFPVLEDACRCTLCLRMHAIRWFQSHYPKVIDECIYIYFFFLDLMPSGSGIHPISWVPCWQTSGPHQHASCWPQFLSLHLWAHLEAGPGRHKQGGTQAEQLEMQTRPSTEQANPVMIMTDKGS